MDKRTTCIAASGYGGIPPAAVLSSRHGLKLSLVRESEKFHGKASRIDGYVPEKGDVVSVIDDVVTTGKTIKKAADIIKATGAEVAGCYAVVKRGETEQDIRVSYLFSLEDIL